VVRRAAGRSARHAGRQSENFRGTLKRLLRYLKPHAASLIAVVTLAVLGTVFTIISPKLLGDITTILFEGVTARLNGEAAAVDFQAIGRIIAVLIALYTFSSIFSYVQ